MPHFVNIKRRSVGHIARLSKEKSLSEQNRQLAKKTPPLSPRQTLKHTHFSLLPWIFHTTVVLIFFGRLMDLQN